MLTTLIKPSRFRFSFRLVCLLVLFSPASFSFDFTKQAPLSLSSNAPKGESVNVFIMVDDSKSANEDDGDYKIRLSTIKPIIDFVVGYGWVSNNQPSLFLYRYGGDLDDPATEEDDETVPIWPDYGIRRMVTFDDLPSLYGAIHGSFSRSLTQSGAVENLPTTFAYLKDQIKDLSPQGNNLVIVINQGEIIPENSKSPRKELLKTAAISANQLNAPLAVFVFNKDNDIQDEWKNYFIANLDVENIYCGACGDREIWDAIKRLYEAKDFLEKSAQYDHVAYGLLKAKTTQAATPFPSTAKIKMVSLQFDGENYLIDNDAGYMCLPNLSALRCWISTSTNSPIYFRSNYPVNDDIVFIYGYESTLITPTFTVTFTETATPTSTVTPTLVVSSKYTLVLPTPIEFWSYAIPLGFTIVSWVLFLVTKDRDRRIEPTSLVSRLLTVYVLVLVILVLLRYISSDLTILIAPALITDRIKWILWGGGAGGGFLAGVITVWKWITGETENIATIAIRFLGIVYFALVFMLSAWFFVMAFS